MRSQQKMHCEGTNNSRCEALTVTPFVVRSAFSGPVQNFAGTANVDDDPALFCVKVFLAGFPTVAVITFLWPAVSALLPQT